MTLTERSMRRESATAVREIRLRPPCANPPPLTVAAPTESTSATPVHPPNLRWNLAVPPGTSGTAILPSSIDSLRAHIRAHCPVRDATDADDFAQAISSMFHSLNTTYLVNRIIVAATRQVQLQRHTLHEARDHDVCTAESPTENIAYACGLILEQRQRERTGGRWIRRIDDDVERRARHGDLE